MDTKISDSAQHTIQIRLVGTDTDRSFVRRARIGRDSDNDFVVEGDSVSGHHVEVVFEDDRWHVRDLGSTNGTYRAGERLDHFAFTDTTQIRLGFDGPAIRLKPMAAESKPRPTPIAQLSESSIAERYFGDQPLENMGKHTMMVRRVFAREQKKRAKKYWIGLGSLAAVAATIGFVAYAQRQQIERQQAAAADLFYAAKSMELEVARLQLSTDELESFNQRRDELRVRYEDFVDRLGIYGDGTPAEERLIYRVVRRLGESEVNVPRPFVAEVRRYIERWKTSGRLESALARAEENGYTRQIADIMLRRGLPPDFMFLALQESEFKTEAIGPRTRFGFAKGMWQFMPGTAKSLGLQTGPLVGFDRFDELDERHDFLKSTQAAAQYIRDLYMTDAQASGLLVLASYNWGQGNVLRLIRSMPENPQERNFWSLLSIYRDSIPQETYGYVFSIISAAVIAEDPGLFGFDFERPLAPATQVAPDEVGS